MARDLVFCPLCKTLYVEGVHTLGLTCCQRIAFHDFHLTNRTNIFWLLLQILVFFLHYYPGKPILCIFEKICNFVRVDDPIRNDVPKFFYRICILREKGMRHWQVEDLRQNVESVQAVRSLLGITRTLQIIANGDFEFNSVHVLEDKAGPTRNTNKIEFFFPLQLSFRQLNMFFLQ